MACIVATYSGVRMKDPPGKSVHNRDTSYQANLIQCKFYLKDEIGTRKLVHNKRMFILSDPDCINYFSTLIYSVSVSLSN